MDGFLAVKLGTIVMAQRIVAIEIARYKSKYKWDVKYVVEVGKSS